MTPPPFLTALTERFNRALGDDRKTKGESALYRAVRAGNLRAVKRALRGRADVNRAAPDGTTPLHVAAYWGETEIVTLLVAAGADVHRKDDQGWTPLHAAAVAGGFRSRGAVIALLMDHGAHAAQADKHGWRAQDYMALWDKNPEAAEKLRLFLAQHSAMPKAPPRLSPPRNH